MVVLESRLRARLADLPSPDRFGNRMEKRAARVLRRAEHLRLRLAGLSDSAAAERVELLIKDMLRPDDGWGEPHSSLEAKADRVIGKHRL